MKLILTILLCASLVQAQEVGVVLRDIETVDYGKLLVTVDNKSGDYVPICNEQGRLLCAEAFSAELIECLTEKTGVRLAPGAKQKIVPFVKCSKDLCRWESLSLTIQAVITE